MLLHKSVEFDSRVRREASSLAAAGHQVHVLELAPVPDDAAMLDGFRRSSVMPADGWARRLPFHLYRLTFLVSFVRGVVRLRPDVVHAHDAAMLLPGMIGSRLAGASLVYDSHELAASVPYRERIWAWFVTAIERLVVPRCAAVITVSDGIARRLQERYGLATMPAVVRNVSALSPGGDGSLREQLGLSADAPLVLHQGAPAPDRGCEVLVDAIAQLDGVRLVFLGDPEPGYGAQLSARIRERGVADRVSLLPSVPLKDLLAFTAEADVGVTLLQDTCENHRLALPNKLFEYIAAGVPVIASALPEAERLVDHYGIGWCVPPADAAGLASTLELALAERGDPDRKQRLARAARELTWSEEQARLIGVYQSFEPAGGAFERSAVPPLVLQLVRNGVSTDARVLRAARTAERSGTWRALVLGVASDDAPQGATAIEGVRVIRVRPFGRGSRWRRPRGAGGAGAAEGAGAAGGAGDPGAGGAQDAPVVTPQSSEPSGLSARARLRRIAAGVSFALQAVAIARRERPAIVHANDWNTMWAGCLIKLLFGPRLLYDSHELWADRNGRWESRPWLVASEALFVRLADVVTTTSPGHARALAARYRIDEPLVVRNIPEWVATGGVSPSDPPLVVYVGGLMPGRGLEQVIEAMRLIPDVRLCAIGPGGERYRSGLLARAAAAGVAGRVELRQPVAPSAIRAELDRGSVGLCLIQPICRSYELCLPNKLLEYAAAGIPILASELPVIEDVVRRHDLGAVVAPTDVHAIARSIQELLEPTRREQVIANSRRFAAENTWQRESRRLADSYAGLVSPDGAWPGRGRHARGAAQNSSRDSG